MILPWDFHFQRMFLRDARVLLSHITWGRKGPSAEPLLTNVHVCCENGKWLQVISQDLATLMTELGGVTKPVNANTDLKDHAHYLSTQLMNTRYVGHKNNHTRLHTRGNGVWVPSCRGRVSDQRGTAALDGYLCA